VVEIEQAAKCGGSGRQACKSAKAEQSSGRVVASIARGAVLTTTVWRRTRHRGRWQSSRPQSPEKDSV